MKIYLSVLLLNLILVTNLYAANTNRTEQLVIDKCKHCHGLDGEASNVIYPRLAGQHQAYMIKQLKNFRSGVRQGTMNEMSVDLSDNEIIALAEYFSLKPPVKHKIRDQELSAVGKYIYLKGNKFSGVAACASCHGENAHGTETLPRLAGQHKRYVSVQLEEFNSRKRNNDNAIMHSIASKLTELERESVALYVSGLD